MLGFLFSLIGLSYHLTKGVVQALTVIYPSYKSYKALESRSLEASQAMLLYWCIIAFVGAVKEFTDQLLGTYANFFVWKLAILALKTAPLIIGPDRLYASIVKPLFAANEQTVDAVVDEAHKIKSIASDAAAPKLKNGDTQAAKGAAAEIVDVVQKDAADLVHTIQAQALELTDQLQAKSAELGVVWDKKGIAGMLDRAMDFVETAREYGMSVAGSTWEQHGPMIKSHASTIQGKANEYAPIAKSRAIGVWQQQVQPRLQPVISQYDTKVKPFVLSKADAANQLWIEKGGPVRSLYLTRIQPFLQQTLLPFITRKFIPFMVDSFLPAVYETVIVLKERITDLASTPSDEVKAHRAHHKRRRADARRERRRVIEDSSASSAQHGSIYKRQKIDAAADISESKQPELAEEVSTNVTTSTDAFTTAPSYPVSPVTEGSSGGASLKNRKTGSIVDSTLDLSSSASDDNANAALAPVISARDLKAEKKALHHVTAADLGIDEATWKEPKPTDSLSKSGDDSLINKHSNSPAGEKGAAWGGEPRANDIAAE